MTTVQKERIAASIERARDELQRAIGDLDRLPTADVDLVRFVAHALSNYLHVTGATVELLDMALGDHKDPEIHTWLKELEHANRLMTDSVLQLTNTSSARSEQPFWEEVDLSMLAQRATDFYGRVAARKDIQVTCTYSDEPLEVWSDRVTVAAVLDNLLSNAVKFSKPGKQVHVHVKAEGQHLVCSVTDEGPGLSESDQAKLFQRGARLRNAPTAGETTTGYGLAVAKEVAETVHGEVSCKSQRGKGSTFFFRLPRAGHPPSSSTESDSQA